MKGWQDLSFHLLNTYFSHGYIFFNICMLLFVLAFNLKNDLVYKLVKFNYSWHKFSYHYILWLLIEGINNTVLLAILQSTIAPVLIWILLVQFLKSIFVNSYTTVERSLILNLLKGYTFTYMCVMFDAYNIHPPYCWTGIILYNIVNAIKM